MDDETAARRRGRQVRLRLGRSLACRTAALGTVAQQADGTWTARLGGPRRGCTAVFRSAAEARTAVHQHYNAALLAFMKRQTQQAKKGA